jgi:hypothetical protein
MEAAGIDPVKIARGLWRQTGRNEGRDKLDSVLRRSAVERTTQGEGAEVKGVAARGWAAEQDREEEGVGCLRHLRFATWP